MAALLRGRWGPPVAPPAFPLPPLLVRLITGLSRTPRDRAGPFPRYRDAHISSGATIAASTVSNWPTVVIGDSPRGFSSRR
jgi:hypothetical protein